MTNSKLDFPDLADNSEELQKKNEVGNRVFGMFYNFSLFPN